ncbi:hypothetical protein M3215_19405 [Bacillus cytotoxicus]|uniref:Uncharacterized protein n=1 Tax=Bacillus cytotoxicus TaxID=580165 RepID=A0ACC6AAH6_9BACI|nr:hypothetical protein [Bacillus cytotoxicus]
MIKRIVILVIGILMLTVYTPNSSTYAQLSSREEQIKQIITNDFKTTHRLNFNGYQFVNIKDIAPDKANLTIENESLANILVNISEKQIIGDWAPLFYINTNKQVGYVLEKKLSGKNILHKLSFNKSQNKWKITDEINIPGKSPIDLGLLEK